MPRDRAACDKAIREAWKRERELVLVGKGTRDWTEEQQLEIIELGKVFDDDGVAFVGQHMKSAAAYPEHQGNPDNIQLLSITEHLAAHKGSWQNPTNWYYDPVTKEFADFAEKDPVACAVIELNQPFSLERKTGGMKDSATALNEKSENKEKSVMPTVESVMEETHSANSYSAPSSSKNRKGFWRKAWDTVKYYGGKAVDWVKENPKETAKIVIGAVVVGITGHEIHKNIKNNAAKETLNNTSDFHTPVI